MSANNVVYIKKKTFEVYYQNCADNPGFGDKVGKGKSLEEAVEIAQKEIKKCDGNFEYGIWFI